MDTIFTLGDSSDTDNKINLDELYEKKKQHDLNTISTYNRILNRIHSKIKVVSRQNFTNQSCWFVVPEIIIGVPRYDHSACTAYIIDKLRDNGFIIRYTHPNLLFISWKHWIPSYVRNEIKNKTGMVIDGYGNKIVKNNKDGKNDIKNPDELIFHNKNNSAIQQSTQKNKDFKNINTYVPSGNLIYNQDLLQNIEDRTKK